MEKFIRQQYRDFSFTETDIELIAATAEKVVLSKGDFLVKEGQVNRSFFLVQEGVLRAYWSSEERDITLWFAITGEPLFSSWGYVEGRPSRLNIVASSTCHLFSFKKEDIQRMMLASPVLCLWLQHLVEKLLLLTDEFLIELSKPSAKERYLSFIEKVPYLLQEVPLKEIAGYLGMTPQSLSRIRAEIVKKNHIPK